MAIVTLGRDYGAESPSGERFVTVPEYGVVNLALLMFAWDLEARGCRWEFSDDGKLLVRPNALLTDADRSSLRANAKAFRALVRQCEAVQ